MFSAAYPIQLLQDMYLNSSLAKIGETSRINVNTAERLCGSRNFWEQRAYIKHKITTLPNVSNYPFQNYLIAVANNLKIKDEPEVLNYTFLLTYLQQNFDLAAKNAVQTLLRMNTYDTDNLYIARGAEWFLGAGESLAKAILKDDKELIEYFRSLGPDPTLPILAALVKDNIPLTNELLSTSRFKLSLYNPTIMTRALLFLLGNRLSTSQFDLFETMFKFRPESKDIIMYGLATMDRNYNVNFSTPHDTNILLAGTINDKRYDDAFEILLTGAAHLGIIM